MVLYHKQWLSTVLESGTIDKCYINYKTNQIRRTIYYNFHFCIHNFNYWQLQKNRDTCVKHLMNRNTILNMDKGWMKARFENSETKLSQQSLQCQMCQMSRGFFLSMHGPCAGRVQSYCLVAFKQNSFQKVINRFSERIVEVQIYSSDGWETYKFTISFLFTHSKKLLPCRVYFWFHNLLLRTLLARNGTL